MSSIEIDTFFGDKVVHIEISASMGVGGATYHVVLDRYYSGSLMKSSTYGWQVHLHPNTILPGDDVAIIIDLIERNLMGEQQQKTARII